MVQHPANTSAQLHDRLCANGAAAGKTTLLQLLAGKYMVPKQVIRVLGESPFYDMVRTTTP
jgi:ABC-type uncharacterized transport system ATPase subunit